MTTKYQFHIAQHWNSGDIGCGQLIVGVRSRLGGMRAGELLELSTQNAGAPMDLPAWCRMSGHELISAHHPVYVIKKANP